MTTDDETARDAARDEFANTLLDSLTNDQANWSLRIIFDRKQLHHGPTGLAFYYPLDWVTVVMVDGPEISVGAAIYTAIQARAGEIIAKQQTTKLEGN